MTLVKCVVGLMLAAGCAGPAQQLPAEQDPANPRAPEGQRMAASSALSESAQAPTQATRPGEAHEAHQTTAPEPANAHAHAQGQGMGSGRAPATTPDAHSHAGVHESHGATGSASGAHAGAQPQTAAVYTCPMHPEVSQPGPGRCPKCGMDLVLKTGGASAPQPPSSGSAHGAGKHSHPMPSSDGM